MRGKKSSGEGSKLKDKKVERSNAERFADKIDYTEYTYKNVIQIVFSVIECPFESASSLRLHLSLSIESYQLNKFLNGFRGHRDVSAIKLTVAA